MERCITICGPITRYKIHFLLYASFTFMLTSASCKKAATLPDHISVPINECVSSAYGRDRIKICFDKLTDSRCPVNVVCIWAGFAGTQMQFYLNGTVHHIHLETITREPDLHKDTIISNYKIELLNVTPLPGQNSPATTTAELKISRL